MSAFEEQELRKLASALSGLTPRPAHLDRDGILFEAGRRSVRLSRLWPIATLVVSAVACVLAVALLVRPNPPAVERLSPGRPLTAPTAPPESGGGQVQDKSSNP